MRGSHFLVIKTPQAVPEALELIKFNLFLTLKLIPNQTLLILLMEFTALGLQVYNLHLSERSIMIIQTLGSL